MAKSEEPSAKNPPPTPSVRDRIRDVQGHSAAPVTMAGHTRAVAAAPQPQDNPQPQEDPTLTTLLKNIDKHPAAEMIRASVKKLRRVSAEEKQYVKFLADLKESSPFLGDLGQDFCSLLEPMYKKIAEFDKGVFRIGRAVRILSSNRNKASGDKSKDSERISRGLDAMRRLTTLSEQQSKDIEVLKRILEKRLSGRSSFKEDQNYMEDLSTQMDEFLKSYPGIIFNLTSPTAHVNQSKFRAAMEQKLNDCKKIIDEQRVQFNLDEASGRDPKESNFKKLESAVRLGMALIDIYLEFSWVFFDTENQAPEQVSSSSGRPHGNGGGANGTGYDMESTVYGRW